MLSYNMKEELISMIKNVLIDYVGYENVKQNGYKKVLANHTFTNRIQQVINIAGIQNK